MSSVLRWIAPTMSWFFDILPGVNLIPDRIRKILAGTFFVPGAILASIGWAMEQSQQACTSCAQGTLDGFLELLMMVFGVILMLISLCLWPWSAYEEESQS